MTSDPKRIRRRRSKGWRMPEGAVYVGRPGRWGNPVYGSAMHYSVPAGRGAAVIGWRPEMAMDGFLRWVTGEIFDVDRVDWPDGYRRVTRLSAPPTIDEIRDALAGRDLACWCPLDQPCHADVLLELANR